MLFLLCKSRHRFATTAEFNPLSPTLYFVSAVQGEMQQTEAILDELSAQKAVQDTKLEVADKEIAELVADLF